MVVVGGEGGGGLRKRNVDPLKRERFLCQWIYDM